MKANINRRSFIRNTAITGVGAGLLGSLGPLSSLAASQPAADLRIGIIGLDTSHAVAFTKAFNNPVPVPGLEGMKIVAAFPQTSPDIAHNQQRLPGFTEEIRKMGVTIVDSMDALLAQVDAVLVGINDGRPHLAQAAPALKAGKKVFIDKPMAASLVDAMKIFELAQQHQAPVFSASSLRFMESAQKVAKEGAIGRVLGADTYSPAPMEKTHSDLFWYGIHGVETLYTVMGTGCTTVTRFYTPGADVVVGTWDADRIGTFRGTRSGPDDYGGHVFGEKGGMPLGPFKGYDGLVQQIAAFFRTGVPPVKPEETLEILAFMEAAAESRKRNGEPVKLEEMFRNAKEQLKK